MWILLYTTGENATQQEVDDFIAESVIMVDFDHPNVMRLMGVCLDADDGLPLIVLPYMENGDLRSFLKEKRLNNTQTGNVETDLPEVIIIVHEQLYQLNGK